MSGSGVVTSTGRQNIDGLLSGSKWASPVIAFAMPVWASQYEYAGERDTQFKQLTTIQAAVVLKILGQVSSVTDLAFQAVDPASQTADMRFARSGMPSTAWAYDPSDAPEAGGVWINSTSPFGTYIDHFDTTRWLARADLTGNWEFGQWRFTPSAGISYFEDEQDAYVDSNGIAITGQTVSLGRVTFGPEVGYRFKTSDGSEVKPFVGFQGIWDFDSDGTTVNGVETGGEGLRGKAQVGLGLISPWGYSIRGTASYDGIGSDDYEAVSGQVWVNDPSDTHALWLAMQFQT